MASPKDGIRTLSGFRKDDSRLFDGPGCVRREFCRCAVQSRYSMFAAVIVSVAGALVPPVDDHETIAVLTTFSSVSRWTTSRLVPATR
jgi:hypothetical protein